MTPSRPISGFNPVRHCGVLCALCVSVACWAGSPAGLTDYEDFRLTPIRNADLVRLLADAELIVIVKFDLDDLEPPRGGVARWTAQVLPYSEGIRPARFKGECGKEVAIEGDPRAFENPAAPYVSEAGFAARDQFLLFLKPTGKDGAYRCIEANPGGFRLYRGRDGTDHRGLYVGRVNGRPVVEATLAGRYGRFTGPTTMRDALEGLALGVRLAAEAKGGASVELRLENISKRPARVPQKPALWAPLLWAEREGPEADQALLSREDYLLLRAGNPWEAPQPLPPGGSMTLRVELPTGPVPEGGELLWARNNHAKPLAGSLGEGEHAVRFLCHVTEHALLLSNPVRVQGKAGAAGPAQLAALEKPSPFVQRPESPPLQPAGPLSKEGLRGEIFFESDRTGNWDVFVMDANGSNVRNLTNTPDRDEFNPMPSPDGKRVAYVAGELGKRWSVWTRWEPRGKEVWVMDREGRETRRVAAEAVRPDWWPDGSAVVYNARRGDGKDAVCVQNLETSAVAEPLKEVATWLQGNLNRASFSPPTRRLAIEGALWSLTGPSLMVVQLDDAAEFKSVKALTPGYRG
ncbi:MAG TPA: hypothetical protein VNE39_06860, partial [Planctomycetota bacterium]|nr:hypothetical protein [Planctomycetota bacterium]